MSVDNDGMRLITTPSRDQNGVVAMNEAATHVAIVTGFSSGLGFEITSQLLDRNWRVVGVARSEPSEGSFSERPMKPLVVTGSVDHEETAIAAFETGRTLGTIEMVVNCAGTGAFGSVGSYRAEEIAEVLRGNLAGLILFSEHAVRAMANTNGSIINIMSTAAKRLKSEESVYVAAKWGAKAYTRTLRKELKARRSSIRVFEVYPCGMRTSFWQHAIRSPSGGDSFPQPQIIAREILARVLTKEDFYCPEITFERV